MKWKELQSWVRRCLAARDYELLSARLEDLRNAIDAAAPAMERQEKLWHDVSEIPMPATLIIVSDNGTREGYYEKSLDKFVGPNMNCRREDALAWAYAFDIGLSAQVAFNTKPKGTPTSSEEKPMESSESRDSSNQPERCPLCGNWESAARRQCRQCHEPVANWPRVAELVAIRDAVESQEREAVEVRRCLDENLSYLLHHRSRDIDRVREDLIRQTREVLARTEMKKQPKEPRL